MKPISISVSFKLSSKEVEALVNKAILGFDFKGPDNRIWKESERKAAVKFAIQKMIKICIEKRLP